MEIFIHLIKIFSCCLEPKCELNVVLNFLITGEGGMPLFTLVTAQNVYPSPTVYLILIELQVIIYLSLYSILCSHSFQLLFY